MSARAGPARRRGAWVPTDGRPAGAAPLVRVTYQRGDHDCGVAALAMLLDLEYDVVLAGFAGADRTLPTRGATSWLLARVAAALGFRVRRRLARGFDAAWCRGVLHLTYPSGLAHWAYARDGLLYN